MVREPWSAHEIDIALFEENGDGTYNPTPTRVCLLAQGGSFREAIATEQNGQPGAAVKDIDTFPDGFEISVNEFYQRKAEQLTPFKDKTKRFRIAIAAVNGCYSGVAPYENDTHVFRDAACTDWRVTWEENGILAIQLAFKAERMEA